MSKKVAVVTGANKGIGFEVVKGLLQKFDGVVYLTSRDVGRGKAAVEELNKLGLHPEYHQLDVSDTESVKKFADHIRNTHGGIDILINNAAVLNNDYKYYFNYEESKYILDINFYSILTIEEIIYPLVRNNGRILNISSDCGHLSNLRNKIWIDKFTKTDFTKNDILEFVSWFLEKIKNGTWKDEELAEGRIAAYKISKMALSALTILQQKDLASRNISVNSVHPGFVRTDMTKGGGFFSSEESTKTLLYLVLEAPQDLKGAYIWYDGKVVDWFDYNGEYYSKSSLLNW